MQQIKLLELTVKKIKNRAFKNLIPEFYELEKIIENNPYHNNESVFNHTLSALTELEKLFEKINKRVKNYLAQKVDFHSRRELLFFAAVFHDIGKKETLKIENNITKCPKHEKMSVEKLRKIIPRFDLSEKEKEIVIETIKNHGFFHDALNYPKENLDKKIKEFQETYPDTFLEVVLLTIADIFGFGGQLTKNYPEEFNFRINFLNKIIDNF